MPQKAPVDAGQPCSKNEPARPGAAPAADYPGNSSRERSNIAPSPAYVASQVVAPKVMATIAPLKEPPYTPTGSVDAIRSRAWRQDDRFRHGSAIAKDFTPSLLFR